MGDCVVAASVYFNLGVLRVDAFSVAVAGIDKVVGVSSYFDWCGLRHGAERAQQKKAEKYFLHAISFIKKLFVTVVVFWV